MSASSECEISWPHPVFRRSYQEQPAEVSRGSLSADVCLSAQVSLFLSISFSLSLSLSAVVVLFGEERSWFGRDSAGSRISVQNQGIIFGSTPTVCLTAGTMQHYVITIFALFCILHKKKLRNILGLMGRKPNGTKSGLNMFYFSCCCHLLYILCCTRFSTCALHGEAIKLKQPEEGAFSLKEGSQDKLNLPFWPYVSTWWF